MMLSARAVKTPRRQWYCDECRAALGAHVRLYGMADIGDPPYALRYCPYCADQQLARLIHNRSNLAWVAQERSKLEPAVLRLRQILAR